MKNFIKNIVITGDSLSYNRYGYDAIPRENAWDCAPDTGSWSFRLRDLLRARGCEVTLTGKGGIVASFLTENFEERIGKFSPDMVILTTGANDRVYTKPEQYSAALSFLLNTIIKSGCGKIVAISPPDSSDPADSEKDLLPTYISSKSAQPYYSALKECCDKYGALYFDTVKVFKGIPVKLWRFDNVHFSSYGNDLLLRHITPLILSQLEENL